MFDDSQWVALGEGRVLVRDGFVPEAVVRAARAEAQALQTFRAAGVGKGAAQASTVRADSLVWLEPGAGPALDSVREALEGLAPTLSRATMVALEGSEVQLARYDEGGFYAEHLDAFRGGGRRRFTAIVYLNADWRPGDGGELEANGEALEPVGGRLVLFRSELVKHAVRRSNAPRYALTAWLLGRQ